MDRCKMPLKGKRF